MKTEAKASWIDSITNHVMLIIKTILENISGMTYIDENTGKCMPEAFNCRIRNGSSRTRS
jgi:hypothetical protein